MSKKAIRLGTLLLTAALSASAFAGCAKKAEVASLPQFDQEIKQGEKIAVMTIRDYGQIKIRFFPVNEHCFISIVRFVTDRVIGDRKNIRQEFIPHFYCVRYSRNRYGRLLRHADFQRQLFYGFIAEIIFYCND